MSETCGAGAVAGIDLRQFHEIFFEEAGENLAQMEQLLLHIDIDAVADEALHAIFRCAHSIKGGAATFGFADVTEMTHQMETLLDRLRRHELAPSADMVDVLLQAGDALRSQLERHRGAGSDGPDTGELLARMRELAGAATGIVPPPQLLPAAAAAVPTPGTPVPGLRLLALTIGPLQDRRAVDGLVELFAEIADLGRIEALGSAGGDGMHHFKVSTACSDAELLDLFSFHVDGALVRLAPLATVAGRVSAHTPPHTAPASAAARAAPSRVESSTLRVSVDKVDQLINLVGELVIAQAMLAQGFAALEPAAQPQLCAGLAELQRHTRCLQEAVMSIRMTPVSAVFSRFPRMLRELAAQMGKKVELLTQGEATELDKGMLEKIVDPLTHLLRNSCDHGIELPAERLARGKPESGSITLSASHQGGSIVIEVRDDGRGLSRDKLLAKARERGLHAPASLSDAEVWALIFAPGFSTAAVLTDVSGRGVGMDVVKQNIGALGGAVEIDAVEGRGMSVRVRLPLTLAIMDGLSVRVADERYVLPLAAVVESFQFTPRQIRSVGGRGQLIQVRDQFLPVLELARVFDVRRQGDERDDTVMVVVDADGTRIAVRVDELLGQQQVVVKNLESNCGPVDNVSGATIMADGRVALILDVGALVRCARH